MWDALFLKLDWYILNEKFLGMYLMYEKDCGFFFFWEQIEKWKKN